jgi:hypothetical protein
MNKITMFSREQETKKVFFQLGKKFHLPLDIIIFLYNTLRKSIYHDRSLQINYHKNILSSHLCGPPYSIFDVDDEFFNTQNPFQYRLPIGKGNEWLIECDDARKENLFYHGLYNDLKPRDIINKQIEIYQDLQFIFKYQVVRGREYYQPLEGIERIKFIDLMGIDLFDLYFEYLEEPAYNIVRMGNSYKDIWFDMDE